jgi:Recombination endonuclease VII
VQVEAANHTPMDTHGLAGTVPGTGPIARAAVRMRPVTKKRAASTAGRPLGEIPGRRFPAEPICWEWPPPDDAQREYALRGTEGIREEEDRQEAAAFRLLVRWCRYRCTVCGLSSLSTPLVMDHDHSTHLCRGILCQECNRKEGFGGGPVFDRYRERPPAAICDARAWYWPSSIYKASPEIMDFHNELRLYAVTGDRRPRGGRPWIVPEVRIASREDLTNEEVAEIIGRTPEAVAVRRRTLTLDLPDIDAWE